MSNLGLDWLLDEHGIRVVTTPVGDRYVLEALREHGGVLGGEQSGHIIYLRDHVTGDGLAAALLLCDAIRGRTLGEAAAADADVPAGEVESRRSRETLPDSLLDEVERLNAELNGDGACTRAPFGYGTVVRVLAEAQTEAEARHSLIPSRARTTRARLRLPTAGVG